MKILMLTTVYPRPDSPKNTSATRVIQHFTESWQQMGHEVVVIHTVNKLFPLIYFLPESVKRLIKSRTTYEVSDYSIVCEKAYKINGIPVFRKPLFKWIPRGLTSARTIRRCARSIADDLQKVGFVPDVILGHWASPSAQLLSELKSYFPAPNALVFHSIREIRILSRDEKKQDDMRHAYQKWNPQYADKIKFYIGDVRDYNSILNAFRGVDFVFHAAALKQVPSCEFFPMEAVKTNIIGSDNVISACVKNGVKKAVFLSTDKAAYPINAMGMTKAVMEKNVIARSRQMLPGDPVLCLTRYGNVMASRGSVIPLFCDRIDEGKPLTITNPNMTRFMMTLSDAVDLVLYAFEHGEQGDLFVQKAPAATIETLAQAVLELKHSDLGTTIIGTRHGEKLFEVLVTAEEMMRAEDLPGFFRIPADNRDLNYDNYFSKGNPEFGKIEQYTSHNTHRLNVEEMKQLLLKLKLFGGTC